MRGASFPLMDPRTTELGADGEVIPSDVTMLLAEADHRIANHLALLMGYVRLKTADVDRQGEAPTLKSVHALLDGVGAQIAAVARLHRALVSDDPLDVVDLGAHLREVCAPFASGLGGAARIVEDLPPGCVVRPEQVLPLSQIAAEVITNALKYASDGGTVLVRCRSNAGGDVRLEIIDNGDGFPAAFDPETDGGLGFRLVRSLGQKLGARIAFESRPAGVRFRLTLTAAASAAHGTHVTDEQLRLSLHS